MKENETLFTFMQQIFLEAKIFERGSDPYWFTVKLKTNGFIKEDEIVTRHEINVILGNHWHKREDAVIKLLKKKKNIKTLFNILQTDRQIHLIFKPKGMVHTRIKITKKGITVLKDREEWYR